MRSEAVDAAVRRVERRRPDLEWVRSVADALTADEGPAMINQAALQRFLWWHVPSDLPEDYWNGMAEAAAELLDELGIGRLARIARSDVTAGVVEAWRRGSDAGDEAARRAHEASGVEPPDTPVLAWSSVMESHELTACVAVERALGDAVDRGELQPGTKGWRSRAAAVTEAVLTRPLDIPPGQTWAGLVTTERVAHWIDAARDPMLGEWRSAAAKRLLSPIDPPTTAAAAVAPVSWLLELSAAPGGAELTQANYLARATVVEAAERFGWWDWEKPPRSEADVHQLAHLRLTAARMHMLRRRRRRLHVTVRGAELLASPADLWRALAVETEDHTDFTRMVTELVGLRLLRGRVEHDEIIDDVAPMLAAQGWSAGGLPIDRDQVYTAIWRPLRWWKLFGVLDEVEATWEYGTGRRLTPYTATLTPAGEAFVLAYLRARAAGPRDRISA